MADDIIVELKGFKELNASLEVAQKTLFKHIVIGMRKSTSIILGNVVARTPVFLGSLRQSIEERLIPGPNVAGEVFTRIPYGIVVEQGRAAGSKMPPIDAIEFWVRRKGIDVSENSRQTAFVIARSIAIKGTKGVFMFKEGLKASLPELATIWAQVGENIVIELAT